MNTRGQKMDKQLHGNFFPALLLGILLMLVVPVLALAQGGNVCIQCHGTLSGKFGEPVALWKKSIHAANAIACNDCHGGDPQDAANAMNPARGFRGVPKETDIPAFCGRCHVGVKNDYLQSAHGKALGRGGPTCITCHSNHLVVKASLELINEKSCSRCHSFERARIIKSSMQETENLIVAIDNRIRELKQQGTDTDKLEKGLFSARNRFHSMFHEVDVEKVKGESAGIIGELEKLHSVLKGIDEERQKRKIIGAIAVGGALIFALIFFLLRKTYGDAPDQ